MRSFIVLAVLVAAAVAAPPTSGDREAEITNYSFDNIGTSDGFKTQYATSNGIQSEQEGIVKNVGTDNEAAVVRGSYSYTAPDGQVISVTYTADENGFQAQGAHIPS